MESSGYSSEAIEKEEGEVAFSWWLGILPSLSLVKGRATRLAAPMLVKFEWFKRGLADEIRHHGEEVAFSSCLQLQSAGRWGSKVMARSCSRALAAFLACW